MQKIKLNLEALSVESFETAAARRGQGTVLAQSFGGEASKNGTCIENTCAQDCSEPTVFEWTCWNTCGGGCLD